MSYLYLSIDYGDSYIGMSVSNGILPRKLPVFKYPKCDYFKLRKHLIKTINDNKISHIIIGLPINENSSHKIKTIFLSIVFKGSFLRDKIIWVNEDNTTIEASQLKSRKRMREDSIAAAIILDRFLLKKKWDNMNENNSTKKITNKDFIILKRKVDELEKEREKIIDKRKFVDGDISENADWIVLTQEFEIISREIEKLRNAISEISEIIPDQETNFEFVDIGSKVTYEIVGEEKSGPYEVEITHEMMTDPFKNKISCKSPLGISLRGNKSNDVLDVPGLNYKVRILKIR